MIVTDIKNIENQMAMSADFHKAIDFLRRPDIHSLANGKVDIDANRIFALVQRHETVMTDVPKFEFHRKYIDIQYIVSGDEIIGWAPADRIMVTEEYDTDRDICFGTVPKAEMSGLRLQAGQMAVLYPEDGHAPKLAANGSSPVFKVVVKIARK